MEFNSGFKGLNIYHIIYHIISNVFEIRTKSTQLALDKRQAEILNEVFWQSLRFVKKKTSYHWHGTQSFLLLNFN